MDKITTTIHTVNTRSIIELLDICITYIESNIKDNVLPIPYTTNNFNGLCQLFDMFNNRGFINYAEKVTLKYCIYDNPPSTKLLKNGDAYYYTMQNFKLRLKYLKRLRIKYSKNE
jgi:hypothetical protein